MVITAFSECTYFTSIYGNLTSFALVTELGVSNVSNVFFFISLSRTEIDLRYFHAQWECPRSMPTNKSFRLT